MGWFDMRCMRALLAGVSLLMLTIGSGAAIAPVRAAQSTPIASPVAAASVEFLGLVKTPGAVSVADLQALPQETVTVTYESGGTPEEHTFTGVRLFAALAQVGFDIDPEARNPLLTMYVVITANDGYQVVLSGGELDPNFGDAPILLAWEQDGAALEGENGPLRLVVPGDLRGGRYVHGVVSIDVRALAE